MRKHFLAAYPILLLTIGHGTVDSYGGLLAAVAPGLAEFLTLPLGDLVMLIGLANLLCNLIQPLVGHIMGRYNLAWTLWLAVVVSTLPCFMGWMPGFWTLSALIILGGMGTGAYHPEAVLTASDVSGKRAYLGVPLFMAGGATLYGLIIPIAIKITETYGFPLLALLVFPGLFVATLLAREYRKLRNTHPSVVFRPRSKRVTKAHEGGISFWPLLAMGLSLCIGGALFNSTLATHYELVFGPTSRHWSGLILMVLGIGSSLASFFWSWLSRRHNYYLVALLTQLIAIPLFLLMASPSQEWTGLAIAIPLSLVTPLAMHPVGVMLSRNASGSTQAMRTSMMVGMNFGIGSLAVMFAGWALRQGMPSRYILYTVALCSLVAAALALWQCFVTKNRVIGGE